MKRAFSVLQPCLIQLSLGLHCMLFRFLRLSTLLQALVQSYLSSCACASKATSAASFIVKSIKSFKSHFWSIYNFMSFIVNHVRNALHNFLAFIDFVIVV